MGDVRRKQGNGKQVVQSISREEHSQQWDYVVPGVGGNVLGMVKQGQGALGWSKEMAGLGA